MRFLADQGISPLLVAGLKAAGHDAVHVRELGMSSAADPQILSRAAVDQRILITEDTDFGGLLILSGATSPTVILFRESTGRTTVRLRLLGEALARAELDLIQGALVVIEDATIRVRRLRAPGT